VALWASVNLLWVGFDLTYVPLRTFWLQRTLYPFPSLPLALPLTLLPSITPIYDPIKGIEPHGAATSPSTTSLSASGRAAIKLLAEK
jgi:hypothetical protein